MKFFVKPLDPNQININASRGEEKTIGDLQNFSEVRGRIKTHPELEEIDRLSKQPLSNENLLSLKVLLEDYVDSQESASIYDEEFLDAFIRSLPIQEEQQKNIFEISDAASGITILRKTPDFLRSDYLKSPLVLNLLQLSSNIQAFKDYCFELLKSNEFKGLVIAFITLDQKSKEEILGKLRNSDDIEAKLLELYLREMDPKEGLKYLLGVPAHEIPAALERKAPNLPPHLKTALIFKVLPETRMDAQNQNPHLFFCGNRIDDSSKISEGDYHHTVFIGLITSLPNRSFKNAIFNNCIFYSAISGDFEGATFLNCIINPTADFSRAQNLDLANWHGTEFCFEVFDTFLFDPSESSIKLTQKVLQAFKSTDWSYLERFLPLVTFLQNLNIRESAHLVYVMQLMPWFKDITLAEFKTKVEAFISRHANMVFLDDTMQKQYNAANREWIKEIFPKLKEIIEDILNKWQKDLHQAPSLPDKFHAEGHVSKEIFFSVFYEKNQKALYSAKKRGIDLIENARFIKMLTTLFNNPTYQQMIKNIEQYDNDENFLLVKDALDVILKVPQTDDAESQQVDESYASSMISLLR